MVRKRVALLAVLVGLGLAGALLIGLRETPPEPAAAAAPLRPSRTGGREEAILRIDLHRLFLPRGEGRVGRRDIFTFGVQPTPPPSQAAVAAQGPTEPAGPSPPTAPVATPPPRINLKYVGSVEGRRGLRVAVLLTERREVLTGQAGEVVGNRYRIVRIGLESVDIQEVGSDRVQRIPMRGN